MNYTSSTRTEQSISGIIIESYPGRRSLPREMDEFEIGFCLHESFTA